MKCHLSCSAKFLLVDRIDGENCLSDDGNGKPSTLARGSFKTRLAV